MEQKTISINAISPNAVRSFFISIITQLFAH
jgi:hypothetical protein